MRVNSDAVHSPEVKGGVPAAFRLKVQGDTETGQAKVILDGVVLLQGEVSLSDFEQALARAKETVNQDLAKFGLKLEEVATQG